MAKSLTAQKKNSPPGPRSVGAIDHHRPIFIETDLLMAPAHGIEGYVKGAGDMTGIVFPLAPDIDKYRGAALCKQSNRAGGDLRSGRD